MNHIQNLTNQVASLTSELAATQEQMNSQLTGLSDYLRSEKFWGDNDHVNVLDVLAWVKNTRNVLLDIAEGR